MSKNIDQVFVANPASSMLTSDLYYLGRAPYGVGNDMAILWSNVLASIAAQASGTWGINITGNAGTVTTNANLTGDVTSSGNATTLATVNSNVGSFGDGTHVGQFTVNAKGLITAASSVAITGAVPTGSAGGDLSGSYPNPSVIKTGGIAFAPSATIDTTNASNITSGVLPLTRLGTTYTDGQILIGSTSTGFLSAATLTAGTNIIITNAGASITIAASGGNYAIAYGDTNNSASGANCFAVGTNCAATTQHSFSFGSSVKTMAGSGFNFLFGSAMSCFIGNIFAFGNTMSFPFSGSGYCFGFGNHVTIHNSGSVVWGDSNSTPNSDSAANQWNTTFAGGYRWFLTNAPLLAAQIDSLGNFTNALGIADISKIILTPTTGSTITLATTNFRTILNPAGSLLALTINMPATPVDGQVQGVTTTQAITTLTVSGNGNSIIGAPTSLIVGQAFEMIYNIGDTTWYPA